MKHELKKEIISKYAREKGDTGSPEVQIALLTVRIESLTDHLNDHKKDNHSRRGLLGLVQKRRRLKNYLQKTNPAAFKRVEEEFADNKATKKTVKAEKSAAIKAAKTGKKIAPKAEKSEKAVAPKAEKKAPAKKTAKKK